MSLGRPRNIYTVSGGDYHQAQSSTPRSRSLRRQNADLFERDPFKVHSYNFHYAERPTHTLQNNAVRATPKTPPKSFETYFYNHDFIGTERSKEISLTTNKFHESRRRKFLQEQPHPRTNILNQTINPRRHDQTAAVRQRQHTDIIKNSANIVVTIGTNANNNNNTSSANISSATFSNNKPTNSPYLRTGCNREFQQRSSVRAVRSETSHAYQWPRTQANVSNSKTNNFNRSDSRTSLYGVLSSGSRRLHNEANGNSTASIGGKGQRESSLQRAPSDYNCRSAQATLVPSKNMLTTNVPNDPNLSGCHININIQALDENVFRDNLTIKIEADPTGAQSNSQAGNNNNNTFSNSNAPNKFDAVNNNLDSHVSNNTATASSSDRFEGGASPSMMNNLDVKAMASTQTFVIDKRISKFSMTEREKKPEKDREKGLKRDAAKESQREQDRERERDKYRNRYSRTTGGIKSLTGERLPSRLPWRVDDSSLGTCFPRENTSADTTTRPMRTSYQSAVTDVRNLKRYTELKTAPPLPKTPERKLLNTVSQIYRLENKFPSLMRPTTTISQQTLRSTHSLASQSQTSNRSSESQFALSPSTTIHSKRNSNSSSGEHKPFNVNINVYSDKLKLLRV